VFQLTKDERRGARRRERKAKEVKRKKCQLAVHPYKHFITSGQSFFSRVRNESCPRDTGERKKGCWEEGRRDREGRKTRVKTSKEHSQSMKGNRSKWTQRKKGREGEGWDGKVKGREGVATGTDDALSEARAKKMKTLGYK